jgi:uncharacterized membrane protein
VKILTREVLILLIVLFLLNNFLEVFTRSFSPFTSPIFLFNYLILPGALLIMIFKIKRLFFWEWLFYSTGLSILFLEIGGVLINCLGFVNLLNFKNPLSFNSLLISFNIFTVALFILAWIRQKGSLFHLNIQPVKDKVFYLIPLIFPLLAIFGAISINNGGSNLLTLSLLLSIGVFIIVLTQLKKSASNNLFAYSLFFIGLSMLFTTSLRSYFITGHDITKEYYVFNLTNSHQLWDLSFYKDAYNACLSITVLPTVLTNLLKIEDMYIYKVIYQILFALCPVIIYYVARKFSSKVFAFLSAIYFIAFPTFFNDMPMLNRQEIAFIFFGILLYVLIVSENLSDKLKALMFVIFAFGVIISHYSTNYVLLALLSMCYIIRLAYQFVHSHKMFNFLRTPPKDKFTDSSIISIRVLIVIFALTFLWNNQLTKTSSNIGNVMDKVVQQIFVPTKNESRSTDVNYSIFFRTKEDPMKALQNFINKTASDIRTHEEADFYNPSQTKNYPVYLVDQPLLPATPLGNALLKLHIPVFIVQSTLRQLSALFIQLAVFLGITIIVLRKSNISFSLTYLAISFSGLALLMLIIVLPSISVEYGLLRMFQQMLFLFSLPIVITTNFFFSLIRLKENPRSLSISLVAVAFLLTVTGFLSHLTGLYPAQMTLENAGNYYESYYNTYANKISSLWLKYHLPKYAIIQSDTSGSLKLIAFAGIINSQVELFPQTLLRDAFVYLPNQEKSAQGVIVSFSQDTFRYNSPKSFLDDNKNLIYSNGQDVIYR